MSVTFKRQNIFFVLAILLLIIIVVGVLREVTKDGVFSWFSSNKSEPVEVSIVNLIADPQKYDGKKVRVIGIGCAENDIDALYLTKDDYTYSVNKNAIWLDFNQGSINTDEEVLRADNGKYVVVEGIFNKSDNGKDNMFSGSINKISKYEIK